MIQSRGSVLDENVCHKWVSFARSSTTLITVELVFATYENQTYVKKTTIIADSVSCCLISNPNGKIEAIESGDIRWIPPADITATVITGDLVPIPRFSRTVKNKDGVLVNRPFNPITSRLLEVMGLFAHKNTSQATLSEMVNTFPFLSPMPVFMKSLATKGTATWRKSISTLTGNDPRAQLLRQWLLIHALPKLCRQINLEITNFSLGIRYLEPLRATAQRYYRPQELAVDEIDSKGENLAVLIDSMDETELTNFNEWLYDNLGFEVMRTRSGGHISLKVRFNIEEESTNLADTGFGVSQVLPIATQLWTALYRRPRREQERMTTYK